MCTPLRADFDGSRVRAAAPGSKDRPQTRRLLALAAIYDGATRTQAAELGGVTLQIVRDWVVKFNADGPEGPIDRKALAVIMESGPILAVHGTSAGASPTSANGSSTNSASRSPRRR